MVVLVRSPLRYIILDTTLDDSVGEVMDKMANVLKLKDAKDLSDLAARGMLSQEATSLTKDRPSTTLSFSGLKTKYMTLAKESIHSAETISCMLMNDMASLLLSSCNRAYESLKASKIDVTSIVVSGGVAKCGFLRRNPVADFLRSPNKARTNDIV
jgi:tRNA A37 threonylcarbamoyltransferase TsaD